MNLINRLRAAASVVCVFTLALGLAQSAKAIEQRSTQFLAGTNLFLAVASTNTYATTNSYVKGGVNTTNTAWAQDVPLSYNPDGSLPSCNISIEAVTSGAAAAGTNTVKCEFAVIPVAGFAAATHANGLFSFTVTMNGATPVCVTTNVPTAVLQGNAALRLLDVYSANAGTNTLIRRISLNRPNP